MIHLGGGQGFDVVLFPVYGLIYGIPAYFGACVVRRAILGRRR